MISPRSTLKGLWVMRHPLRGVNYAIKFGRWGWGLDLWTPVWHEGRGPYISMRLGCIRFFRGY